MALDTYTGLKAAVADYVNRTDLTSQIVDAVTLAEGEMRTKLREAGICGAEVRATSSVNAEYETAPTRFGGAIAMKVYNSTTGVWESVENASPVALGELKAAVSGQTGQPTHFSYVGGALMFHPTPDKTYTVEMIYMSDFAPLSGSNASNWILADYPQAYLYGALYALEPLLMEDERMGMWGQNFARAVQGIIEAETAKIGQRDTPLYRASDLPIRRRTGFNINTGY